MLKNTHVPVMFWRSVGSSQNAFFVESYIDELAQAAGQDPYKFRRALLAGKSDFLGVLDKIAEKSDWGKPLPAGRGRGIAIHECYGSIIGQVAEVTVSQKGEVRVDRVVAAVDCGHVVNPGIVEAQIQSGVIYGLSAALYGEITIKDGRVEQSNFDDYQVVSLADTPKIEVYLALSGGTKWGGIGEPGTRGHRARGRQCGVRGHRHARALAAAQEREAVGAGLGSSFVIAGLVPAISLKRRKVRH